MTTPYSYLYQESQMAGGLLNDWQDKSGQEDTFLVSFIITTKVPLSKALNH